MTLFDGMVTTVLEGAAFASCVGSTLTAATSANAPDTTVTFGILTVHLHQEIDSAIRLTMGGTTAQPPCRPYCRDGSADLKCLRAGMQPANILSPSVLSQLKVLTATSDCVARHGRSQMPYRGLERLR